MDKVYRLYIDDEITRTGFGLRYKPLEERHQQLEEELPRLQGEIDSLKIHFLSNNEVFSNAHDVYQQWPKFSFKEKRNVVENLVDHIIVERDRVVLELTFSPNPPPPFPKHDKIATHGQGFMTPAFRGSRSWTFHRREKPLPAWPRRGFWSPHETGDCEFPSTPTTTRPTSTGCWNHFGSALSPKGENQRGV